ncbi:MAG: HAMP domain-containing sensor histidine kinase, partial [Mycobacteriaceae bacterium]
VAQQLSDGGPQRLDPALLAPSGGATLVQVVGADGRVLAATPGSTGPGLVDPGQLGSAGTVSTFHPEKISPELRVAAETVPATTPPLTAIAAVEQQPITNTLSVVAALLAGGVPVVVLVVAGATYVLVDRSLRPVEQMRRSASAISTADLSDRLPVPQTRDEVARLATTLNAMLDRVEAGHGAQRRFVGDASHELRSPLATLTTALEVGARNPDFLDHELLTDRLLPEAVRMQHLIDDLLLLARADERGLPLRTVDVDLDDILDTEAARLRAAPGPAVSVHTSPTRVRGDSEQLTRAIRNLVDNAARHARQSVTLHCSTDGDLVQVVVADDGPGIEVEQRHRVLERFVRLDDGRARSAGGSGLGLAIVAEIVAAHGGDVRIGASRDGGAEVTLTLPRTPPPSGQPPSSASR